LKLLSIETNDLKHNIKRIKEFAKTNSPDDKGHEVKIIAVVKSNGYGLGLVEYTKFLRDNGIENFAVATIDEAVLLRKAGIKENILELSATAIEDDIETLVKNNVVITIGSKEDLEVAEKVAKKLNRKIKAHLKIDTGFGRYGFVYTDIEKMMEALSKIQNIEIEGTYSHFSVSFFNDKYTKVQFDRFIRVIEVLKMNKFDPGILHICNSSAFLKFPNMHLNAVRIGSAFTGRLAFKNLIGLRKIATFEANVTEIKDVPKRFNIGYSNAYTTKKNMQIAIVPVGYMDGVNIETGRDMFRYVDKFRYISRSVKDLFKKQCIMVTINGQKCEVLGRVGTYHITCDVTGKNVKIGDKVIIPINPKYVNPNIRREYI
jgi:alanine racemase